MNVDEILKAHNLQPSGGKPKNDDWTDAPGSKILKAGTMKAGFFGEVSTSDLISGDELASLIGLTAGTSQFSDEPWLKFALDGDIIFVAKKPFRHTVSWDSINSAGAVFGDKIVKIKGLNYSVSLLRGLNNSYPVGSSNNPSDGVANHGSEWNRLMLPIHVNAPSSWSYPDNVDSPTEDWGIDYTDKDLLTHYNHGDGNYSWCQDTSGTYRLVRGYGGVSYSLRTTSSNSGSGLGWRPKLKLVTWPLT